jgi:uncharacterized protein (DUF1015 family)
MAQIFPFQPYRYSGAAGPLDTLVTQPYDKITPEMRTRYLSLSPYNMVRVILGERSGSDTDADNVYTRAAAHLADWIARGVLVRDPEPALFAYFQEFSMPDTGERLVRKSFVGLGAVEDYDQRVVHRHEQTLSGPKKDRIELLRHTHAHAGQLFMLYPDPEGEIDRILDQVAAAPPDAAVTDEHGAIHRLWKIADAARIASIQRIMAPKKLLIADGHHRYETALAFRDANPGLEDARRVMMTFVGMESPGLKILATHRLVGNLAAFDPQTLIRGAGLRPVGDLEALERVWAEPHADRVRIGVALAGIEPLYLYDAPRAPGDLDVPVLHTRLIAGQLGIGEEAVRDEKHTRYMRGAAQAIAEVRRGAAQVAFLLEPTPIADVARVAFSGGVMPQKSTDFYPKLLSGLLVYKVER